MTLTAGWQLGFKKVYQPEIRLSLHRFIFELLQLPLFVLRSDEHSYYLFLVISPKPCHAVIIYSR